jgi:hypothetical protein
MQALSHPHPIPSHLQSQFPLFPPPSLQASNHPTTPCHHHLPSPQHQFNSFFPSQSSQSKTKQNPLTSGTASLSACALAASVVTVLVATAALDQAALLRRAGAAYLALNARENMVLEGKRAEGVRRKRKRKRIEVFGYGGSEAQ